MIKRKWKKTWNAREDKGKEYPSRVRLKDDEHFVRAVVLRGQRQAGTPGVPQQPPMYSMPLEGGLSRCSLPGSVSIEQWLSTAWKTPMVFTPVRCKCQYLKPPIRVYLSGIIFHLPTCASFRLQLREISLWSVPTPFPFWPLWGQLLVPKMPLPSRVPLTSYGSSILQIWELFKSSGFKSLPWGPLPCQESMDQGSTKLSRI